MNEKNKSSYIFGSKSEKFISAIESNLAFDSILIVFSIITIVVLRKKMLTWPISLILSIYFLLFFFGKGMSGGFYLLGSSNEDVHNNFKDAILLYNSFGIELTDQMVAWRISYYIIIASLLGEFIWVSLISMMIVTEARKIFHETII